ncbi:MAG: recombinase family protein, partial [Candidatus Zixiibacteriota bacterium]
VWKEKRYVGSHDPLISKKLFDQAQSILTRGNRSRETKRGFAFAGLVKCGLCGCAMTPEVKKGKYIYYHCTQYKGSCDNVYIREEKLAELLADVVKQVQIGDDAVEDIKRALLESQKDKVDYHTASVESLHLRYRHVQSLLDRAYEDKLSGKISEDFWQRKSAAWEDEMVDIRFKIKAHESANLNYFQVGTEIR